MQSLADVGAVCSCVGCEAELEGLEVTVKGGAPVRLLPDNRPDL